MPTRTARSRSPSRPPRRPAPRWRSCPKHSLSLWNKYDVTPRIAGALGIIARGDVFTSTDNLVVLPDWVRVDAAVFYAFSPRLRLQANVENLFDTDYYLYAHSNTNITPGSPVALRVSLTTRFRRRIVARSKQTAHVCDESSKIQPKERQLEPDGQVAQNRHSPHTTRMTRPANDLR